MSFIEDMLGNPEVERLKQREAELLATIEELRGVLKYYIYEITCLSPRQENGSHWCNISMNTLEKARQALNKTKDIK